MGAEAMQAIPTRFETVYRKEFPFVWAAARRLGVPPAALDDAVQDVFLTAHRRWDELDYEVSARGWLYGVTRRVAFRYRRTAARTARRKSAVSAAGGGRNEPHAELEGAHDVDAVLAGLEEGRREVFVMSELLDMSGPEIAAELSIPLNTVYSRLRLARRQLERKVTRGRAGWLHGLRREQKPPREQARRTWALLLPSLGKVPGAVVGTTWTAGKIGATVAAAGVLGIVLASVPDSRAGPPEPESRSRVVKSATPAEPTPARGGTRGASISKHPQPAPTVVGDVPVPTPVAAATPVLPPPTRPSRGTAAPPETDSTSPSADEPDSLAAEVAVLDRATAALREGQPARALQWLSEHARRFPEGRLSELRQTTRVRTLCRLGRHAQARTEASGQPKTAAMTRALGSCEDA
ncbi:MAG: sigma-70 family RNA polymerase sigma factor [Myxococcota bacterium]